MTPAEFEELARPLGELEDYLRRQATLARAINHTADALTLDEALRMAIVVHAYCQLMVEKDFDQTNA